MPFEAHGNHKRNGYRTGGGNVTAGTSGKHSHETAGYYSNFCWTAGKVTGNRLGEIHKQVGGVGNLKEGCKQHEEYNLCTSCGHKVSKHTLCSYYQLGDQLGRLKAHMGKEPRHIWTQEAIHKEHKGNYGHSHADRSSDCLKGKEDEQEGEHHLICLWIWIDVERNPAQSCPDTYCYDQGNKHQIEYCLYFPILEEA